MHFQKFEATIVYNGCLLLEDWNYVTAVHIFVLIAGDKNGFCYKVGLETPWFGKYRLKTNRTVDLQHIFDTKNDRQKMAENKATTLDVFSLGTGNP